MQRFNHGVGIPPNANPSDMAWGSCPLLAEVALRSGVEIYLWAASSEP